MADYIVNEKIENYSKRGLNEVTSDFEWRNGCVVEEQRKPQCSWMEEDRTMKLPTGHYSNGLKLSNEQKLNFRFSRMRSRSDTEKRNIANNKQTPAYSHRSCC